MQFYSAYADSDVESEMLLKISSEKFLFLTLEFLRFLETDCQENSAVLLTHKKADTC
jgi:hypothetical protein